jgi:hypothetical protein
MKTIGESTSSDHVASTRYAEHFKNIIENCILQQILKHEATGLKFKHTMQAVMAPYTKVCKGMADEEKGIEDHLFLHIFGVPILQCTHII